VCTFLWSYPVLSKGTGPNVLILIREKRNRVLLDRLSLLGIREKMEVPLMMTLDRGLRTVLHRGQYWAY
jgi:hypothetical protein